MRRPDSSIEKELPMFDSLKNSSKWTVRAKTETICPLLPTLSPHGSSTEMFTKRRSFWKPWPSSVSQFSRWDSSQRHTSQWVLSFATLSRKQWPKGLPIVVPSALCSSTFGIVRESTPATRDTISHATQRSEEYLSYLPCHTYLTDTHRQEKQQQTRHQSK